MDPCTICDLVAWLEGADTVGYIDKVFVRVPDSDRLFVVTDLTVEDSTGQVVLKTEVHKEA